MNSNQRNNKHSLFKKTCSNRVLAVKILTTMAQARRGLPRDMRVSSFESELAHKSLGAEQGICVANDRLLPLLLLKFKEKSFIRMNLTNIFPKSEKSELKIIY